MDEEQANTQPLSLFYSYTAKDEKLCHELEKHLYPLNLEGLILPWSSRCILPGEDWQSSIDEHIQTASIILLCISPDFLSSEYHVGIEVQRALERHKSKEARVILILLRPAHWEYLPFASLQYLPRSKKPVTSWRNRDAAWLDIVKGIHETIKQPPPNIPSSRSKFAGPPTVQCTKRSFKYIKNGFIYEIDLKTSTKNHIFKVEVDYGWKHTFFLDGEKLDMVQVGLVASLSLALEVYRRPVPIISYKFMVDSHCLEYTYYCKKTYSRGDYLIIIASEEAIIFKDKGLYYNT